MSIFSWFPQPDVLTWDMAGRTLSLSSSLALFIAAAWSAGAWGLKLFALESAPRLERFLLSVGLGMGFLGLIGLGLGLCGWARPAWMFVLIVALALSGTPMAAKAAAFAVGEWNARPKPWKTRFSLSIAAPLLVLIVYGVYDFLLALGPNIFYDSLVYHTALPELFLNHARIFPTPFNIYSGIPSGVEMLYLWILPLDPGGSLCQMLHWSLGVFTALAIAALGKRMGHLTAGVWAAAIFYSNPMVLILGREAGVELGSSFYLALTLSALFAYSSRPNKSALVLAGIFSGLAMGTKYQMVLIMPAAALWLIYRQGLSRGARAFLWVGLTALAIALPWGAKNIAFYKNPIYPFKESFFSSASVVEPGHLASAAHGRGFASTFGSWPGFLDFARRPWFYSGSDEIDNQMSPAYLMILPFLLMVPLSGFALSLLLFAAAMILPMNVMSGLARFNTAALVPLSLVAGLTALSLPTRARFLARGALILSFLLGGFAAYGRSGMYDYWEALQNSDSASDYLAGEHPGYPNPPYSAFQWANLHLPPDARILLMGDERPFYLDRDYLPSSLYARQPLQVWIQSSASSAALYQKFLAEKITHIILSKEEYLRTRDPLELSAGEKRVFRSFWKDHIRPLHVEPGETTRDDWDFAFYGVVPLGASGQAGPIPYFLLAGDR